MKKLTALLVAITILTLAFALNGCANSDTFTAQAYTSGDSKIEAVTIDVLDREIEISISDDNQINIDFFESEKESYDISVSESNILNMTFSENKKWTDFVGAKPSAKYRKINIQLPRALLSRLDITTTNEKIKLFPLVVSDSISLSSRGGSIEFEQIDVGKSLTLTAKNGNINGTVIGSYDAFSIACTIKKGHCNLPLQKPDGNKTLKANCNNGDIKIDFVK